MCYVLLILKHQVHGGVLLFSLILDKHNTVVLLTGFLLIVDSQAIYVYCNGFPLALALFVTSSVK